MELPIDNEGLGCRTLGNYTGNLAQRGMLVFAFSAFLQRDIHPI
jgi:hypothetical protein